MTMRLFLFAAVLAIIFVLGCSDGKLTLLLTMWVDHEEESSSSIEYIPPSSQSRPSSSSIVIYSSSEEIPSSSSEEEPSSSSEEPPSSSSEEVPPPSSSSDLPVYSSPSGIPLENVPTLEDGDPNVQKGWASRYWDGCKPTCSWPSNIVDDNGNQPNPYVICKNCDRLNKEMPTYFMDSRTSPDDPWNPPRYLGTQSGCESPGNDIYGYWGLSVTYKDWLTKNPDFPGVGTHPNYPTRMNGGAHTCLDMIPVAVNDTLAYAFGATPGGAKSCGKCYQLQFDGYWDSDDRPRVTHSALKGKTLIIMASNTGHDVGSGQFDVMIPGGGTGAFDGFSWQIGKTKEAVNGGEYDYGGLLTSCFWGPTAELRDGGWNASLEEWQTCLRKRCRAAFSNISIDTEGYLLKGCLWHADWYMATDNPTVLYKEIPCPQYLRDKYKSSVDIKPPDGCISGVDC